MRDITDFVVNVIAASIIPLNVYFVGYLMSSEKITRFGLGLLKFVGAYQVWAFIYVGMLVAYEGIFLPLGERANDDAKSWLLLSTFAMATLSLIALVRNNKVKTN